MSLDWELVRIQANNINTIVATHDLEWEKFDVVCAYSHAQVQEEVFVIQPLGLEDGTDRVCRLNKALRASRQRGTLLLKTTLIR